MTTTQDRLSPIERYTHNMSEVARQGILSPLADCEAVIDRIFQILARNNKCNPVLLADDETRRWAVVGEVARRMAGGNEPEMLAGRQIILLDYEMLFADLADDNQVREERRKQAQARWEEKLGPAPEKESDEEWLARVGEVLIWPQLDEWIAPTMVLERLQTLFIAMHKAEGRSILFVDHIHRLLGGGEGRYSVDAFSLLKPVLARRQVQLIGECSIEEYRQYIERDAAMQRRFQEVVLPILTH